MLKPNKTIKLLKHQNSTCRGSFNLLCWNIAKLSLNKEFKKYLQELISKEKLDFLLLQEVKKDDKEDMTLEDFSYILSVNMQTKKHLYGVLNAFKIPCIEDKRVLTSAKEFSFLTHKSSLFTLHTIKNDQELLVVNIHAINFVTSKSFKEELNYIKSQISSFEGALIVAGDFNAWSKKRVKILRDFAQILNLEEVTFKDHENIKRVFGKTLDFVFYRDLKTRSAKAIKCDSFSDHNPIIVDFIVP